MTRWPVLGLLPLLAFASPARAWNVQTLQPVPTGSFVSLEDATRPEAPWGLGLAAHHAHLPLVLEFYYSGEGPVEVAVVNWIQTADLQAWRAWGPVRLGLDLPVHRLRRQAPEADGSMGDAALDGLLVVLDRNRRSLGLALHGRLDVPTATMTYAGDGRVGGTAEAVATRGERVVGTVALGVTTGLHRGRTMGSRATAGLGGRFPLTPGLGLSGEARGALYLDERASGPPPLEALAALQLDRGGPWSATLGGGAGFTDAPGVPAWRALAGAAWTPGKRRPSLRPARDRDGDGVADGRDACPDRPVSYLSARADGCPEPGHVSLQVDVRREGEPADARVSLRGDPGEAVFAAPSGRAALSLPPGSWDLQVVPDLAGPTVVVPLEVVAGVPARLAVDLPAGIPRPGGPAPDRRPDVDGDGIPDGDDLCPDQMEDLNRQDDTDGCPDGLLTATRITVADAQGAPVPGARVTVLAGPLDGSWSLPGGVAHRSLLPGPYRVQVAAPGFLTLDADLVVPDAEALEAPFHLQAAAPPVRLLVQVSDTDGLPLPARLARVGAPGLLAEGGADGTMEVVLTAGDHELVVSADGYGTRRRPLHLEPGDSLVLEVVLRPPDPGDNSGAAELARIPVDPATGEVTPAGRAVLAEVAAGLRADPGVRLVAVVAPAPRAADGPGVGRALDLAAGVRDHLVQWEAVAPERLVILAGPPPDPDLAPTVEIRVVARLHPEPTEQTP